MGKEENNKWEITYKEVYLITYGKLKEYNYLLKREKTDFTDLLCHLVTMSLLEYLGKKYLPGTQITKEGIRTNLI